MAQHKKAIGPLASKLSSECGVIVRTHASLKVESWKHIPWDDRMELFKLLLNRIHLDLEQEHVVLCVNDIMADCYRSHRYKLEQKYNEFGSDEEGRKHPPKNISLDIWEYLCDIWCK
ncbi:hypothetical protein WN943_027279 [Citrus x changshan-huyou]